MKRQRLPSRGFALIIFVACSPICSGCQTFENPWAGEPYQEPSARVNTHQSVYAPMPSILPTVQGAAIGIEGATDFDLLDEWDPGFTDSLELD